MGKNLYNRKEGGTMKKILSIGVMVALLVMFVGCGSNKAVTDLQNKVDELQTQVDNLNTAMDKVVENINNLKQELQKKNLIKKEVAKPIKVK